MASVWLQHLEQLRPHLQGRDSHGQKGSLRWLEHHIRERGGRSGTVRNIIYKDLGSSEEKSKLFSLLCELYREVGLPAPYAPKALTDALAKQALGRDKRLIYARFTRELERQRCPQRVVVGGPATGKGVLLEQLRQSLPQSLFINFARDIAPTLVALAKHLAMAEACELLLARLSPSQPYALQAELQAELRTLLAEALNRHGRVLLLRAEAEVSVGGVALRDSQGQRVELSAWLEPLLAALRIPYLAACSSAPPSMPHQLLRQPSREEARHYLRQRLPELPSTQLETLLNRAGRNYGELSRLALLELSRDPSTNHGANSLLRDPQLGRTLRCLAVLSPDTDPAIPRKLLEKALGQSLESLSQAERSLLEPLSNGEYLRPALRKLLPEHHDPALHRVALCYYQAQTNDQQPEPALLFRLLYHAQGAQQWPQLLQWLERDPAQLALLPGLWGQSQAWQRSLLERLAVVVVRYRAVIGDYNHPEVQQALHCLASSEDQGRSSWARVKMAEQAVDAGDYLQAERWLENIPSQAAPAQALWGDESSQVRAEALLVEAALLRWQGRYVQAEALVQQTLDLPLPPLLEHRARLWQGLVAKDAGRFEEALQGLRSVSHNPLLVGRARYQEGDLLMRLGRPAEGAACIRSALAPLEANAPQEEYARVLARLATVLRRLGEFAEAQQHFQQASSLAPDAFSAARIASEWAVLDIAQGHAWPALQRTAEAERTFRHSNERPAEARYRHCRTLYRMGIAYAVLHSGEPYLPPFGSSHASLPYLPGSQAKQQANARFAQQAISILRNVLQRACTRAQQSHRYAALYSDSAIALTWLLPLSEAEEVYHQLCLLPNLAPAVHSYVQQSSLLQGVALHLRRGQPQAAAAALAALRQLPPDPALRAWKAGLEAEMLVALQQVDVACTVIHETLPQLPAAFRSQLGRVWGRTLEHQAPYCLEHYLSDPASPLTVADQMALLFSSDHVAAPKHLPRTALHSDEAIYPSLDSDDTAV